MILPAAQRSLTVDKDRASAAMTLAALYGAWGAG